MTQCNYVSERNGMLCCTWSLGAWGGGWGAGRPERNYAIIIQARAHGGLAQGGHIRVRLSVPILDIF